MTYLENRIIANVITSDELVLKWVSPKCKMTGVPLRRKDKPAWREDVNTDKQEEDTTGDRGGDKSDAAADTIQPTTADGVTSTQQHALTIAPEATEKKRILHKAPESSQLYPDLTLSSNVRNGERLHFCCFKPYLECGMAALRNYIVFWKINLLLNKTT